jgi:hypothetical protein
MNRSILLKLAFKFNRIFTLLNKYFFILPILSYITSMRDTKIFNTLNSIFKLILIINIILGVGLILYFTDFNSSINTTYSIYSDLLEPYIEIIKNLYKSIKDYLNNLVGNATHSESSIKELESVLKERFYK